MSVEVRKDVVVEWAPAAGSVSYKTLIKNDAGTVVRTGTVATTQLIYTYTEAQADGGPWPSLTVEVKAVDAAGNESPNWQSLVVNSPFQASQAASQTDLSTHLADTGNPHSVTLAQLGAGSMAQENIGVSGTFTTTDGKTVTVVNGVVTGIV